MEWDGRNYDPDDFDAGSPINRALSTTAACLYGLCHAVIVSLSLSPALGFVHVGDSRSFVYDLADLYKAETSIPVAFDVVSRMGEHPMSTVDEMARRAMRDRMWEMKLPARIVADLSALLLDENVETAGTPVEDVIPLGRRIRLWGGYGETVDGGRLYGSEIDDVDGGVQERAGQG